MLLLHLKMKEVIGSYLICYAIGYMIFARPYFTKRNWGNTADKIFYISLVVLATIRYCL